jgi:hypothetical protein
MSNEDTFTGKFLIADEGDGFDTIMHADRIVVVPIETLDVVRRDRLEDGDYEKILKHGGEFPGIYLSEIFEILEENNLLEEILSACKLMQARLADKNTSGVDGK